MGITLVCRTEETSSSLVCGAKKGVKMHNPVLGYIVVLVGFLFAFLGALVSAYPKSDKPAAFCLFGIILILVGGWIAGGKIF